MKKMLLSLLASFFFASVAIAQCDKQVVYSADRTDMIGTDGQVENSKTEPLTLTFNKGTIVLNSSEKGDVLTGTVKETDCQWKTVYQEGKAIYKLDFQKPQNGDTSEGSITVEAKEGKLTILIEIAKMDGRKVKLIVSKFEEK